MEGPKKLILGAMVTVAIGFAVGIVIGLAVGWFIWPVKTTSVDLHDLKASSQDDYIIMTANAFGSDQDLDKAEARLDLLRDTNIVRRLSILAKMLAQKSPKDATYVANLAIALGAQDDMLSQLAFTPTAPPRPTSPPTATLNPTVTPSPTAAVTIGAATRTPTRPRPTATATAKPIPISAAPSTNWIPSFPAEWPGGANFQPASVAPGTKYWHIAKAQYCDDRDSRNGCPDLPGGDTGTSTYVMISSEGGGRTSAPLLQLRGDGSSEPAEEKSADDPCNCNYNFMSAGYTIKLGGYPSDAISGLALYSVRMKLPQSHTRYFLWFQLTTR